MAHYAITYVYAAPEEQAKYRPAHREYLASQIEAGNLIVSGPLLDGEVATGALLIAKVDSAEDAEKIVANDPMNVGGAVVSHTVTAWNPVLGTIESCSVVDTELPLPRLMRARAEGISACTRVYLTMGCALFVWHVCPSSHYSLRICTVMPVPSSGRANIHHRNHWLPSRRVGAGTRNNVREPPAGIRSEHHRR